MFEQNHEHYLDRFTTNMSQTAQLQLVAKIALLVAWGPRTFWVWGQAAHARLGCAKMSANEARDNTR